MKKSIKYLVSFSLPILSISALASPSYTIDEIVLEDINGSNPATSAVNNTGSVSGSFLNWEPGGPDQGKFRGFVNSNSGTHELPVIACTVGPSRPDACNTRAHSLNDSDIAVGETWTPGSYWPQAFIWKENNPHPQANEHGMMALMPGFNWSYARDINNSGFIVGNYRPPIYANRAFLHHEGNAGMSQSVIDLGTLGGYGGEFDSSAYAINDSHEIVGFSEQVNGQMRATMWRFSSITAGNPIVISGKQVIDLGILPGADYSTAFDINNLSQAVGFSHTNATGARRGFLWQNGVLSDIGDMCTDEDCYTEAYSINDNGDIVGFTYVRVQVYSWWPAYTRLEKRAFVVKNGTMYDLNDLVASSPVVLNQATSINNTGQITVHGGNRIYTLTPVY